MSISPESPQSQKSPTKASPAAARSFGRAANWAVGIAAALLVLTSVGGYFYHREQLSALAAEHLRLIVTGPSSLQAGVAAEYMVSTTTISGQAIPSQIEVALLGPDGKRLKAYKEPADDRGRLQVLLPADLNLPPQSKLRVVASHRESQEEAEMPLWVEPVRYTTELTLDKPEYQPGEMIRFRSVTLSWFSLEANRNTPIHFEIHDPRGTVVPNSSLDGTTEHGVGSGAFAIPDALTDGPYTLIVRSPERVFPEQEQPFFVRKQGPPKSDKQAEPARDSQSPDDELKVAFYPEAGELVAGLENRVYFACRNSEGKPVSLSGMIVAKAHGDTGRDRDVAVVETTFQGMGTFSLTPRAGETYRLRITSPAGAKREPTLPEVISERDLVLTTGTGVFAPEKPLEFNIRAAKAGMPLVVAAYCRGVQVGEQPMVTKTTATAANPVVIPLDRAIGGVVRLVVYDYSTSSPKPVAERLVYRRPARKMNVRAVGLRDSYAPGEKVDLSLLVTNENGEPVPAALGAEGVDEAAVGLDGYRTPAMPTRFLLTSQISNPQDVEDADFYLSDRTRDEVPAAVALDLLLGTQRAVWHAEQSYRVRDVKIVGAGELVPLTRLDDLAGPPAMFDNIAQIRTNYEKSMADYQAVRTNALNTLTTASFFGGLGLMLLVAMLGLMRIVSGMHLWIAAVGATTCCLIVGAILMDPGRLTTSQDGVVAFSSYFTSLPKLDKPQDRELFRPKASPEQSVPIAKPAPEAKNDELSSGDKAVDQKPPHSTLFWKPLLIAGPDGKASVSFELPNVAAKFRVTVDAHGDGRIGAGQIEIVTHDAP